MPKLSLATGARRRCALIVFPALALAAGLALVGCGDDATGPGSDPVADFSGVWDLDLEVVAKRACGREIGTVFESETPIIQDGRRATMILHGRYPVVLTMNGSRATGRYEGGEETYDVDLSIAGGELRGTLTLTVRGGLCSEESSFSGVRMNAQPSDGFAGDWELDVAITQSDCEGDTPGDTEDVCRRISVRGNSVIIHDPDGPIVGVGDGDTATFWRYGESELLQVGLALVAPGELAGEMYSVDYEFGCSVQGTLAGALRDGPCPPPPAPDDFAGSWIVEVVSFTETGCIGGSSTDYFASCMTVSVDGSTISVDDGSGRGPVTGSLAGETAILERTDADGTYVLEFELELDGNLLAGSATKTFTSGECTGSVVEIEIVGLRSTTPCGETSGGSFAGFWNISGTFTDNSCGLSMEPYCSEFLQDGDTVYLLADGLVGTVTGNTLNVATQVGPFDFAYSVVLAGGGDSFSGTVTVTYQDQQNPANDCTSVASVTGTRTSGCVGEFRAGGGDALPLALGLRAASAP